MHGLMPGRRKVNNRKPPKTQTHLRIRVIKQFTPAIVRSAMQQAIAEAKAAK